MLDSNKPKSNCTCLLESTPSLICQLLDSMGLGVGVETRVESLGLGMYLDQPLICTTMFLQYFTIHLYYKIAFSISGNPLHGHSMA